MQVRPSTATSRNPLMGGGYTKSMIQQEANHFKSNMTAFDKERIFEDLMQHKERINALAEENYKIKTSLVNKERELKKYEKVIEEIQFSGNLKSLTTKFSTETFLYTSLKKQIKELQDEIKFKSEEINQLKRSAKYTKFLELEQEKKCFMDETVKMRSIIQNLEEKLSTHMYNNEYYYQLENQNTINNHLVTSLRFDNQELENQLRECRRQLKSNKEIIDKQALKIKILNKDQNQKSKIFKETEKQLAEKQNKNINQNQKQNIPSQSQAVSPSSKIPSARPLSARVGHPTNSQNSVSYTQQSEKTQQKQTQSNQQNKEKNNMISDSIIPDNKDIQYISQLIKYGAISKNITYERLLQEFDPPSKNITLNELSNKLDKEPFNIKDINSRFKMILSLTDNQRNLNEKVSLQRVKQYFMQIVTEYSIQAIQDATVENEIQNILRSNQQELKNSLEPLFSSQELIDSLQKNQVEMSRSGFDLLLLRCYEFSEGQLKTIPRNDLLSYCGLKQVTFGGGDEQRRNSVNKQQAAIEEKKKKDDEEKKKRLQEEDLKRKKQNEEEQKKKKEEEEKQKMQKEEDDAAKFIQNRYKSKKEIEQAKQQLDIKKQEKQKEEAKKQAQLQKEKEEEEKAALFIQQRYKSNKSKDKQQQKTNTDKVVSNQSKDKTIESEKYDNEFEEDIDIVDDDLIQEDIRQVDNKKKIYKHPSEQQPQKQQQQHAKNMKIDDDDPISDYDA